MNESVIDKWIVVDNERRELNKQAEGIRQAKKAGGKNISEQDRQKIIELKQNLVAIEAKLKETNEKWQELLNQIPNIHSDTVPIGKTEEDNVVVYTHGDIPKFTFSPKNHVELTVKRGLIDFERGSKVAGSQFYFLQGDLVLLEMAIVQFVLDYAISKGYTPLH